MRIKFEEWARFGDHGTVYRSWVFQEDVPDLEAEEGNRLLDSGPACGCERFAVRRGTETIGNPDERTVADSLFYGKIPRWDPPRAGEFLIADALTALQKSLDYAASMARVRRPASTPQPESPTKTPEVRNRFLRLKRDDTYSNGDRYRDFELLVDVPELPVSRDITVDPPHAIKGDILREEPGDRLTPFELRRNGHRIGDPEWWQLEHLFEGLEGDAKPTVPTPGLPHGWQESHGWLVRATAAVPEVDVRVGELLLLVYGKHDLDLLENLVEGTRPIRIPRSRLPVLADAVDRLEFVASSWTGATLDEVEGQFRSWARRGNEDTARVFILRPLRSPVSQPIHASNDAVAIFELLHQVAEST